MKEEKEKIFEQLLWMPRFLSLKIYNIEKLGFNLQDMQQELSIKLWESIETYFNMKEKDRKINLKTYCWTSLQNKKIDYIRKINREKRDIDFTSISGSEIYQSFDEKIITDLSKDCKLIIDGYDVLNVDCDNVMKRIYKDFVLGYSINELSEIYGFHISKVKKIIGKVRKLVRQKFLSVMENFSKEKTFILFREEEPEEILIQNKIENSNRRRKYEKNTPIAKSSLAKYRNAFKRRLG